MSNRQRWDLPDYGTRSLSESLSGVTTTPVGASTSPSRGRSGYKLGEGVVAKVRRKASVKIVFVLMILTSAIAFADLYLLGTAIPH